MVISTTNMGNRTILKISGRFDFSKHYNFRSAYQALLRQPSLGALEIEMSDIDYFDSSSLGMLLLLRECAKREAKKVLLSKPNPDVAQTLATANFDRLFTIL